MQHLQRGVDHHRQRQRRGLQNLLAAPRELALAPWVTMSACAAARTAVDSASTASAWLTSYFMAARGPRLTRSGGSTGGWRVLAGCSGGAGAALGRSQIAPAVRDIEREPGSTASKARSSARWRERIGGRARRCSRCLPWPAGVARGPAHRTAPSARPWPCRASSTGLAAPLQA